jgi:hypothetical protein
VVDVHKTLAALGRTAKKAKPLGGNEDRERGKEEGEREGRRRGREREEERETEGEEETKTKTKPMSVSVFLVFRAFA